MFIHFFTPPAATTTAGGGGVVGGGAGARGGLRLGGLECHGGWWAVGGLCEQHVFLHRCVFHHPGPPGGGKKEIDASVRN